MSGSMSARRLMASCMARDSVARFVTIAVRFVICSWKSGGSRRFLDLSLLLELLRECLEDDLEPAIVSKSCLV